VDPDSSTHDAAFDFDRFYLSYRKAVLRACHSLLDDWQQAEDVTQEAFLALHQSAVEGKPIHSPRGYVQSWAYYLAIEALKPHRPDSVLIASAKLTYLIEHRLDLGWLRRDPPLEDLLGTGSRPQKSDPWESLSYWGRRILEAAIRHTPRVQKKRLFVLMASRNRSDAVARLARRGDLWARSSISMMLTRYSERIDAFLRKIGRNGPQTLQEERHWPFFLDLCAACPGLSGRGQPRQNTLGWLIRGLQRLGSVDRHELVASFFLRDPVLGPKARRLRSQVWPQVRRSAAT